MVVHVRATHVGHDSHMRYGMLVPMKCCTQGRTWQLVSHVAALFVTCRIHMCDMPQSYVWHAAFICVRAFPLPCPSALFFCRPIHLRLSVTHAWTLLPPLHVFVLFQEPWRAGDVGDTGVEARVFKVQTSFTEVHMSKSCRRYESRFASDMCGSYVRQSMGTSTCTRQLTYLWHVCLLRHTYLSALALQLDISHVSFDCLVTIHCHEQ